VQVSRQYGFIPAVSVINLDEIPDYGLDTIEPADVRVSSIVAEASGEQIILIVHIDNVGLSTASLVTLTLWVDGEKIAEQSKDFEIGEAYEWQVLWENPEDIAQIEAGADFQDSTPGDNQMSWAYTSAALSFEPLLPPDQQQRRSSSNGPDITATAITFPISIDGDLSEWQGLPCMVVDKMNQISYGDTTQWSGPEDLSGEVCYGWDNENLYIAFRVWDSIIVQKFTGSSLWKGDHVELWFDTQLQLDFDSAEAGDDDYQIGVSPGDFRSVSPDLYIFTPPTMFEEYVGLVEFASKRTSDGYSAEIRIPVSVLRGLRLAEGHAIGVTFETSDTDTLGGSEQEMMMSSAPQSSGSWGNPTLWNNLIFSGQP
jgi:hypothetical protein